jgi:hypothetical protein
MKTKTNLLLFVPKYTYYKNKWKSIHTLTHKYKFLGMIVSSPPHFPYFISLLRKKNIIFIFSTIYIYYYFIYLFIFITVLCTSTEVIYYKLYFYYYCGSTLNLPDVWKALPSFLRWNYTKKNKTNCSSVWIKVTQLFERKLPIFLIE